MRLDRRSLLVAGGAGVGLVVAFLTWPRTRGSPLVAGEDEKLFGPYLKIATDGRVIVAIPQAETGQGIWTGLAMIAADALGAAWEQVAIEPAPYDPAYANTLLGRRATASATSLRAFAGPLRAAAETARGLLVKTAAKRWSVDPRQCRVGGSMVRHSSNVLSFAQLAEEAASLRPAGPAGILDSRLLGQELPRIEAPAKCDGSLRFAADVRLPHMVFAAVQFAPRGGRLIAADRDAVRTVAGLKAVSTTEKWIAVAATDGWTAQQALKATAPRFQGPVGSLDDVWAALDQAIDAGPRVRIAERGDFAATVGNARALAATYRIAPAPHESLEPMSATARWSAGRLEVWVATQAYDDVVALAARVGAIQARNVTVYPMPVGDGAGSALEADIVEVAVILSRELGRPVQVTVSPNSSTNRAPVRPPMVARMAAMPAPDGTLAGWSARFATVAGLGASLARLTGDQIPAPELPGAAPAYAIPSLRVDSIAATLPITCGYMRGGNEALTCFANESFIDELARSLGREPFAFRMAMLSGSPRLAKTLSAVATLAQWDGGGPGSRMGIACASAFGSHIALVATAGIDANQRVAVEKLVAVVDCGEAIHPGLVRQQVEGSLLHALTLATMRAPAFVAGMPVARSLSAAGATAALKVPEILVDLMPGNDDPGGVSGLGHVVLAPALANALAAATGRRLRNLPFNLMAA
jgi:isoquinoline 1-oxidoreductase beta subunit